MERSEGGEQSQEPQPWGRLTRLGAEDEEPHVLRLKREWTIGRKKGCDLCFPDNKLVSGDHCKIIVDEESGQVSLEDTSTNGTIINKLILVKKRTCPLQTGDVIYVVYRKNEPENNVAYLYESLNTKHDDTQEPVEVNVENQCHVTEDTSSTGRSNDETRITSSPSATQSCYEESQPSTSTSNLFNAASTSLTESASVQQDSPSTSGSQSPVVTPVPAFPISESLCVRVKQEKLDMDVETSTVASEITDEEAESDSQGTGEEEGLEPAKKKLKGDSQSPVVTPVPAFPISESLCVRVKQEKLDMDVETSTVASEITDEEAESDSQGTGEEEGLEPAKKKLKGDSQSPVVTPVPAFPISESLCVRVKQEKLDMDVETSTVASEITDEEAESDSQGTGEEEGLEPAKKKLKGDSQSSVVTPVPAFPISESLCVRVKQEKLDMDVETSTVTSEITDEEAESDSQGTGEEEGLEPAKKKLKGEDGTSTNLSPAPPSECITKIDSECAKTSKVKPDKIEETLTCIICQELLHDCVSLQPCMHTFCAACYSGWMERSSLCPTCRSPVGCICKNHILNSLVEAYLIQHPEKCRNEDDIRSMDARNKITQDMLQPKVRRSFSDEEGSSEDLLELSDVDSESSDISQPYIVCRQCPGYRRRSVPTLPGTGQETEAGGMQALGDAPSTSANFPAAVQEYVCPARGSHIICTCCFQPMPDRRAEREQNPDVAPQQCTVCLQPFCHLYWGCTRMSCFGCLAPFCEINLGDKCLDGILNNNHYESDLLKDYLEARGLTWRNVLSESLVRLQKGVFMLSDYRITGDTVLCYCCGLRSFRELAYQYREKIPAAELPVTVTSRPDCYWGRNCRTQVKAHHAMKFNHICEQTRFKNL